MIGILNLYSLFLGEKKKKIYTHTYCAHIVRVHLMCMLWQTHLYLLYFFVLSHEKLFLIVLSQHRMTASTASGPKKLMCRWEFKQMIALRNSVARFLSANLFHWTNPIGPLIVLLKYFRFNLQNRGDICIESSKLWLRGGRNCPFWTL